MGAPGQGLDKILLKSDIKDILSDLRNMTDTEFANHQEIFAERLSAAIDLYVRSGKVITVGSATTQQGAIT